MATRARVSMFACLRSCAGVNLCSHFLPPSVVSARRGSLERVESSIPSYCRGRCHDGSLAKVEVKTGMHFSLWNPFLPRRLASLHKDAMGALTNLRAELTHWM